ncbi:MAG: DUF6714 family protein [Pirellulaceae bacterium]|nr:DUF6714 family protein [Pirellulaceae bacterium]
MSEQIVDPDFVIASITQAWNSEVYTSCLNDELHQSCASPEAQDAKQLFIGKKWQEVDDLILLETCPSPFLIGNAPIRYYLGAFLLCAVRNAGNPNCPLMDYLVEFELKLPRKPRALDHFRARFDLLAYSQKHSVACFLQFCHQYYSAFNARAARRVLYSHDNYWAIG